MKHGWKRKCMCILCFFWLFISWTMPVYASEEEVLSEFDFDEVNDSLQELFPEEKLDFKETVMQVISGDLSFTAGLLNRLVSDQLWYVWKSNRQNLIHILGIALAAAIFHNFSQVFQNKQVADISFYMLYLLLIALCLNSFQIVMDWVLEGSGQLIGFMQVFCPMFFLAVAIAKGSVSAVAYYNLVLILIFAVEYLIVNVLIPIIHVYMLMRILDHLTKEGYLSKFCELIEIVVSWVLKTFLACVVGINLIQGLISPAIDSVRKSVVTRSAEAIPGIGDALGGVAEVVLGTAVLVKNGIGVTGAIICFALCLLPLMEVGLLVMVYKLAAALIQPVSDKRIVGCIEGVGEGCQLLLKVIFTIGLLFLLTIAIITALTGGG